MCLPLSINTSGGLVLLYSVASGDWFLSYSSTAGDQSLMKLFTSGTLAIIARASSASYWWVWRTKLLC